MGRRALRQLDPEIDLRRFLKTFDELPSPWDAAALFDRDAPLEVEVGSGKGLFMRSAATIRPEHNFLGIEIAGKYARFCAARLEKNNLENAAMVHGDAMRVFRALLPEASVVATHVYFPDPWWKKRHRKRRVLSELFLREVVRVLEPQGRLHFWTDVQEYFDVTLTLIAEKIPLAGPLAVPETPAEHDLDFRTHFERRTRLSGEEVYRAEFVKVP